MSANQSRRRTDLDQSLESSMKPKADNTLPNGRKGLDRNNMRLVEIQPSACESDPVVCTSTVVAFGSRPKFEALSYMCGTETANDAIIVNGFPCEVGKNLLDALRFLRSRITSKEVCRLFWIDALCINPHDVAERNEQVRIMGQIYFRASTVVVWLGCKYAEFQKEMMGEQKLVKSENLEETSLHGGNNTQKQMVSLLRTDDYWGRLWILQEIGRARRLRVCYGIEESTWEDFMQLIAMHNGDGATGPLRLDNLLRKEKYNDSHTLKRLLEDHREAVCWEPRDKIYGLVGLASDAAEFPINYTKSLYEVWKDTMEFMNRWKLFKDESQILPTGALVKSLLMANHADPLRQLSKDYKDQIEPRELIDDPKNPIVFEFQAAQLGSIVCVGPSVNSIVSSPDEATKWRMYTQQSYPAGEQESAHREYDKLFRALLETDVSEIERACFGAPSLIVWQRQINSQDGRIPDLNNTYFDRSLSIAGFTGFQWPKMMVQATGRLAPVRPRLYLAEARGGGETPRMMGVASGLVLPGDAVLWIQSSRRALLGRVLKGPGSVSKSIIVGTALVTEDLCDLTSVIDYAQRWKSVQDRGTKKVYLGAGMVFMLLE